MITESEDKQMMNMITYFTLCSHLRDYIEENVNKSKFNFNKVKMLTNQLSKELEKSVDIVFDAREFTDEDKNDMLDNFVDATRRMEYFFKKGLLLQKVDPMLIIEMSDKINQIFDEYGIK